ncbi:MAG: stage IV sporulation protein A [Clostridia bacterium]|nr:stage IV sporulation protein A [Clostridia bacterium]
MTGNGIYRDIQERTDGNIYIGVVGPVRTGKSTFIKRFMDTLVIPNISGKYQADRATDELPQSAAGKTIMTTEPKFIPEDAVSITIEDNASLNVRMIDCVGYIVPSALGYIENDLPRMVQTPWLDEPIPFNMAAEIGTKKVICEHSTIGLVITTDGSITGIDRAEYEEAEERVIDELRQIGKPFVVLLNSTEPDSPACAELCAAMSEKYSVPVTPVDCRTVDEAQIKQILSLILMEFPVKKIGFDLPRWLVELEKEHWLRSEIFGAVRNSCTGIDKVSRIADLRTAFDGSEYISDCQNLGIDLGKGCAEIKLNLRGDLFYKIIGEKTGLDIGSEAQLMQSVLTLAEVKKKYDKIKAALDEVESVGYGIVMPSLDELTLEEPEMMKQGGRYGVRLRASAPSIHLLKADITTEVAPIVGSEKQSQELVMSLLHDFEDDPSMIWESNIFGKSLHELVNEGLHNKLYKMPAEARAKLRETVERVINDGCNGLICIII